MKQPVRTFSFVGVTVVLLVQLQVTLSRVQKPQLSRFEIGCKSLYAEVNTTTMHYENRLAVLRAFDFDHSEPHAQSKGKKQQEEVLMMVGQTRKYRDHCDLEWLPFRNHSPFLYLSGFNGPNAALLINRVTGYSILFIEELTYRQYIFGDGIGDDIEQISQTHQVDEVHYTKDLLTVLSERWPENSIIHTFDYNLIIELYPEVVGSYELIEGPFETALVQARAIKSRTELQLLRVVNLVTADAHIEMMKVTQPGLTDYQLQSVYYSSVESCEDIKAFKSATVGSGPNSAIMHYNLYERTLMNEDLILIDIGAEYKGYYSDVTRTIPAGGKYTERQTRLYNVVLNAQIAGISALRHGVSFGVVRQATEFVLLQGLLDLNMLVGSLEDVYNSGVMSLFLVHSIAHGVGLDVHDRLPAPLNNDFILQAGMVIAMESGIYLYRHDIENARSNPQIAPFIQFDEVLSWISIAGGGPTAEMGGIRVEDVVAVTQTGAENLSEKAPRDVAEIEAIMNSSQ